MVLNLTKISSGEANAINLNAEKLPTFRIHSTNGEFIFAEFEDKSNGITSNTVQAENKQPKCSIFFTTKEICCT